MIVLASITPTPIFFSFPYWILYVWIVLAVGAVVVVGLILLFENKRKTGLRPDNTTQAPKDPFR